MLRGARAFKPWEHPCKTESLSGNAAATFLLRAHATLVRASFPNARFVTVACPAEARAYSSSTMSQDDDVAAAMECLKIEDGRVVPISPAALSPSRVAAAGGDEGVDVGPGPAAVQHASASLADVTNLGSKSLLPKQHPQEGPWVSAETSRSTVFPDVTPSTHESRGGEGRPQLGPSTAAVQVVGPHLDAAGPAGTPPQARGPAADKAIAGLGPALELLRQAILWPLLYAAEAQHLGLKWPRGVLLHGPPGCGKTSLVCAVAAEAGAIVQPVSASSIFGPYQGME
eukprot:jgi/Botrbrau1/16869/Bobra.150_2s0088.1